MRHDQDAFPAPEGWGDDFLPIRKASIRRILEALRHGPPRRAEPRVSCIIPGVTRIVVVQCRGAYCIAAPPEFHLWFLVGFILTIGVAGRFIGAWIGVMLTKHSRENRMLISIAHTPGGEMQIVVGLLALEFKVITLSVYVAIVFGAVASSIVLGPWMKWALSRAKRPPVITFFSQSGLIPELSHRTREGAISELCEVAAHERPTAGPMQKIASAVMDRESIMGTAIGSRIAIPHARLAQLRRPLAVAGLAPNGIEWDAPDGDSVRLVFLLLTPVGQDDAQVRILQALANAFMDREARDRVLRATDSMSLWDTLEQLLAGDRTTA